MCDGLLAEIFHIWFTVLIMIDGINSANRSQATSLIRTYFPFCSTESQENGGCLREKHKTCDELSSNMVGDFTIGGHMWLVMKFLQRSTANHS